MCVCLQSPVTNDNLEYVTMTLMGAVTMATTDEDQSVDILERIANVFSEIENCTSEDRVS